MAQPVVIISAADDVHADFVVARLQSLGQDVVRFDLGEFSQPGTYQVNLGTGRRQMMASLGDRTIDFSGSSPRSVLYRRPQAPAPPVQLVNPMARGFFEAEFNIVAESLHRLCDGATLWVNSPAANAAARNKLWQLSCATEVGLDVPPTLITNSPSVAHSFYLEVGGRVVVKPLSPAPASTDGGWALFTRLLAESLSVADFRGVQYGSSILQRYIEKAYDVRVAVIGNEVFACQIMSQEDERARVDWRIVARGLPHIPAPAPPGVVAGLRRLRSRLGLATMHADFAVDEDERWWFLETNPNGQWLWLELEAHLPVSMALAELLITAKVTD